MLFLSVFEYPLSFLRLGSSNILEEQKNLFSLVFNIKLPKDGVEIKFYR